MSLPLFSTKETMSLPLLSTKETMSLSPPLNSRKRMLGLQCTRPLLLFLVLSLLATWQPCMSFQHSHHANHRHRATRRPQHSTRHTIRHTTSEHTSSRGSSSIVSSSGSSIIGSDSSISSGGISTSSSSGGIWQYVSGDPSIAMQRMGGALSPLQSDNTVPSDPFGSPSPTPQLALTLAPAAAITAPCSAKSIVIDIRKPGDFAQRLNHPSGQTVVLNVRNSITLTSGLILTTGWECTVISAKATGAPVTLTYRGDDMPVLTVIGTSNIKIQNVNLWQAITANARSCSYAQFVAGREVTQMTCPGVYISGSYGVQVTQANVYGRIDVFRSIYVLLDHLKVTGPRQYRTNTGYTSFNTHGLIRMGETTVGAALIPSQNIISNCEVSGAWELITLHRGANGVTVTRNYLHDFDFAGIRCGADILNTFDCYMNSFSNNYIYNSPAAKQSTDSNNAGIYTCIHWFNPGNQFSCNYIYNQRYCYYLDFVSSGVSIQGGVCNAVDATVKFNGGKYNKVTSLIVANSKRTLGYTSCISVYENNCLVDNGRKWEAMRQNFYNTSAVNKRYPFMQKICNPMTTMVNGVNCNPPNQTQATGKVTGYCSGFPYGNLHESFYYYPNSTWVEDKNICNEFNIYANVTLFNHKASFNVTTNPGFIGQGTALGRADFGLVKSSRIYKIRPNFKSCPRANVGPTKITYGTELSFYKNFWNVRRPAHFSAVLSYDYKKIADPNVKIPFLSTVPKVGSLTV